MQSNGSLTIFKRRELLRTRNRQRTVARNDFFRQAPHRFHAERKWNDIQQQPVIICAIARKDIRLHRRAKRDHFVGVQIIEHGARDMRCHRALNIEHTRRATHHHHAL